MKMLFVLFRLIFATSHTDHIAELYDFWGSDLHFSVKEQNQTFISFNCSAEFPHLFTSSGFYNATGASIEMALSPPEVAQYVLTVANETFNSTRWDVSWIYKGQPDVLRDRSWPGRTINAIFQKDRVDRFFAPCGRAMECSANWPGMSGSSTVCTPEDALCFYQCDDSKYFCNTQAGAATSHGPNVGFVACDPISGEWTIGSRYSAEPCECQKMEYMCQTPGFSEDDTWSQTDVEKKFAEYGFRIQEGCNRGDSKLFLSSPNYIDDVISVPSLYAPTGDQFCKMTCEPNYESQNGCPFTTFTCNATGNVDDKWGKTTWEWTPNTCVPHCEYQTHHKSDDETSTSSKVLMAIGIVCFSGIICGIAGIFIFYCWRNKRMSNTDSYAPLNQ